MPACASCSMYPKQGHKYHEDYFLHDSGSLIFPFCFKNEAIKKNGFYSFYVGWSSTFFSAGHDLVPVQLQTLQGGDIAIPKMEKKFAKRRFMPHFLTYPFIGTKHKMTLHYIFISGAYTPVPTSAKVKVSFFFGGGNTLVIRTTNWIIWQGGPFLTFGKHIYLYCKVIEREERFIVWSWVSVIWKFASWCLFVTMFGR